MDNGPEFTCRVLDAWACHRGIELHFIEPGKPIQNSTAESFNGLFRGECLNQHQFADLAETRALIEDLRGDYDRVRPHTSLGGQSPEHFILGLPGAMAPGKPDHATQPQHELPFPKKPKARPDSHDPWIDNGDRLAVVSACFGSTTYAEERQCGSGTVSRAALR